MGSNIEDIMKAKLLLVQLLLTPLVLGNPCDSWSCTYPLGTEYIEYHPGEVGIVIAVPHGGFMEPESIPDRSWGTVETDSFTRDLGWIVADSVAQHLDGRRPHLVLSNLKRTKLDPNREIVEAAQGNPDAEIAWLEYHGFIDSSKALHNGGVVIDLHGQSHHKNSSEMGYILTAEDLNNGNFDIDRSSVYTLAQQLGLSGRVIIAGPSSFGSYLEYEGYDAFPSARQPTPGDWAYFPGYYTVERHSNGSFDSISVETPSEVRISAGRPARVKFGQALGLALANFYRDMYFWV